MPKRLFTVFEAANEDLQEIYVTLTRVSIVEAMLEFGVEPPPALGHWKMAQHRIKFQSLEFDLTEAAARSFAAWYVSKRPPSGWKFVLDSPCDGD